MNKLGTILNRKKQIKKGKDIALKSKNIKEINDYITLLLHYIDNKEMTLKDSHYEKIIKIIALSDEKTIFQFFNSCEFSLEKASQERKEIFLALIAMIKKYNSSIINTNMIEYLLLKNEYSSLYKHEIQNIIGKNEIENIILKDNNLENIYQYALLSDDCNVSFFEEEIINRNNSKYIYKFARDIKGANISKLEDAISETKDAKYIYWFARDVKEVNMSKLTDAISETKDAKYIYWFAFIMIFVNNSKLADAISETKNAKYIYLFALNVRTEKKSKLADAISETKDAQNIYLFARDIKGANISKLEDAIIETKDAQNIYLFARDIKGANISRLEAILIETKDADNIYWFARDVKGANISKLEDAIIETKDADNIYYFACNVKGANVSRLEAIFIETKDADNIYCFARNVKGANIDKLLLILFELKAYKEAYNVLLFMEVDKKILKKYIKQFMLAGQVKDSIELIELYLKKFKKVDNKNMIINQLIEMNLIDKRDIDDYLINVPVDEQKIFKDNILESDNLIQNSLLESKNKNSSVNETDLIYDNCIYDGSTPFPNTSSSRLKLINLSLVYYNVLPSVVKDFKEVRENVELYLDLLKKCDEKKYYYYKNAFEGKISFEQADSYYKYYLDNLVYDETDLCDEMYNILKLKYSKNKEQKK